MMDGCVANRVRPTLGAGFGGKQARTRKRMERNLNTPNSAQTEYSAVAIIRIVQGKAKDRRMGSVEGREGIVDSTKR